MGQQSKLEYASVGSTHFLGPVPGKWWLIGLLAMSLGTMLVPLSGGGGSYLNALTVFINLPYQLMFARGLERNDWAELALILPIVILPVVVPLWLAIASRWRSRDVINIVGWIIAGAMMIAPVTGFILLDELREYRAVILGAVGTGLFGGIITTILLWRGNAHFSIVAFFVTAHAACVVLIGLLVWPRTHQISKTVWTMNVLMAIVYLVFMVRCKPRVWA